MADLEKLAGGFGYKKKAGTPWNFSEPPGGSFWGFQGSLGHWKLYLINFADFKDQQKC